MAEEGKTGEDEEEEEAAAPDLQLKVDKGSGPEAQLPSPSTPSPCQQPAPVTPAVSVCLHLIHLSDAGRIRPPPPHQSLLADSVTPRDPPVTLGTDPLQSTGPLEFRKSTITVGIDIPQRRFICRHLCAPLLAITCTCTQTRWRVSHQSECKQGEPERSWKWLSVANLFQQQFLT